MLKERNYRIDNIRAISLMCIILAHSGAPLVINNLRSFDVITLVFLSTLVINLNQLFDLNKYKLNLIKRIKRLFFPTFIFILLMTLFQFVIYSYAGRNDLLTIETIINSFLLCEDSVGYVWIMKVYFFNFAISPLLLRIIKRLNSSLKYAFNFIIMFSIYLFLLNFYFNNSTNSYLAWIFINEWLLCCLFYLFVGLDALYFKENDNWKKNGVLFWGFVFLISCFLKNGNFNFAPSLDKRPPGIHYLSYGMLITHLLLIIVPNKKSKFFEWISSNSMEIYYGHTFFSFFMSCVKNELSTSFSYFWLVDFCVAFIGAMFVSKMISNYKFKKER